jgi:hypothetical protein
MTCGLRYRVFALVVFLLLVLPLGAQEPAKNVTVRLVSGRSGKPIKRERLFIFFGSTAEEVRQKKTQLERYTDLEGNATLPFDRLKLAEIQVWTERKMICQKDPDHESFSVSSIMLSGAQALNDCGNAIVPTSPGMLIVYARSPTRREQRARLKRVLAERLR